MNAESGDPSEDSIYKIWFFNMGKPGYIQVFHLFQISIYEFYFDRHGLPWMRELYRKAVFPLQII